MDHNYSIHYENILLRPVREDDLEKIRQWRNSDDIRKWFINQNIIESHQQLNWYHKYLQKEDDLMFIIEETEELKRPLGVISLYDINNELHRAEFGRLMIGDIDARGKGIGLKATKALCSFGFDMLHLNEIYLEVFSDNKSALNIYEKAGFKHQDEYQVDNKKMTKMDICKE